MNDTETTNLPQPSAPTAGAGAFPRRYANFQWKSAAVIAVVILIALLAGASGLVISSTYAPLLIGGALMGLLAAAIAFFKPVWVLYLAIFLVLFPEGLIPSEIQSYLNRSFTVFAVVVWGVDTLTRRKKIIISPSLFFITSFIVWGVITLFWAKDLDAGSTSIQRYVLRSLLFLLLIPNQIKTHKEVAGLMSVLAFSGWVLLFSGVALLIQYGYTAGSRFQVFAVNENSAGIAAMMGLVGVLWLSQHASKNTIIHQVVAAIYLFLAIGLIAVSGSRGSAISFAVAVLVLFCWKPTRKWAAFVLVALVLIAVSASFVLTTTIERFQEITQGNVLGGREALWQAGWALIRDNMMLGTGIGNAQNDVVPYFNFTLITYEIPSGIWEDYQTSLHNPVLSIWAETGLVGLFLYLAVPLSAGVQYLAAFFKKHKFFAAQLLPYYAVTSAFALGYSVSWIKGGGAEFDFTYFLMIGLLTIPTYLQLDAANRDSDTRPQLAITSTTP